MSRSKAPDFNVWWIQVLRYAYSAVALTLLCGRAIIDGYFKYPAGKDYWAQVEKTRDHIWDLSKEPIPSFHHDFHTSQTSGLKIHYITNDPSKAKATKVSKLVIFIHGWPDTSMLWSHVIQALPEQDRANACIVAFDQPSFGASDHTPGYSLQVLFNSIAEFILAMREQYLDPEKENHVIICGHDWGAGIAFVLASEAGQLADRWIISNAAIAGHLVDNISRRLRTAVKLCKSYFASPLNFRLMRKALATVQPVLEQTKMSSYIFIYNLAQPLPSTFLYLGHYWFPRFAAALAAGASPILTFVPSSPPELAGPAGARHLASPMGPNLRSLETKTPNGEGYPHSVRARAQSVYAPWQENIRIYSGGWSNFQWEKSVGVLSALHDIETYQSRRKRSSGAGLFDQGPPGALRAPTTVLWGAQDPALQQTICVDGIQDWFMVRSSQVAVLQDVGHWTPSDRDGPRYWAKILSWSLNGEKGLFDLGKGGKITVSK